MDEKSIEELHRCEYPECMETVVEDEHKCSEHLSNKYDNPIARVTIMAGIPGAGKSYAARLRFPDWPGNILSTDDFWMEDGEYKFDPKRITEAHGWNFQRFLVTLGACHSHRQQGRFQCPDIIIDNTNTTIAEIAPYYAAAQSFGADVQVLAILCPWQVAAERQTHGLPGAKVYQMSLRLEETLRSFPAWWSLEVADNTPPPGLSPF